MKVCIGIFKFWILITLALRHFTFSFVFSFLNYLSLLRIRLVERFTVVT